MVPNRLPMRSPFNDIPERRRSGLDLLLKHPIKTAILTLTLIFNTAVLYVRNISSRDPGSLFFRPETSYELQYSNERLQQAEDFLTLASDTPSALHHGPFNPLEAQLCIGIASVARGQNARYLRTAVSSLLEGLREHERKKIYMIVHIAHSDPEVHPAYGEPWLRNLADKILVYDFDDSEMIERVRGMEGRMGSGGGGHEKRLFDYVYVMRACRDSGAPYVALFEDDILAMDGWFHRAQAAIVEANKQSLALRAKSEDFYFLRLFYTEEYLGWNAEDWPTHTTYSLLFILYILTSLTWLRSQIPFLQRHTSLFPLILLILIFTPLFIVLFFAGGRMTMSPPLRGVHYLANTCCSQAFIFPRQKTVDLVNWYGEKDGRVGDVDVVIAKYGQRNGELKLALTPPVVQHIGRVSSKGSTGHKIFNLGFELNDVGRLREEHAAAVAD